ncbi:MAG: hypothetical protein ACI4HL_04805, partial [Ruminococcus sp.]
FIFKRLTQILSFLIICSVNGKEENDMFNGFGGGNCCWIILLVIIILCCCGGCGNNECGGCGNGCGCGC